MSKSDMPISVEVTTSMPEGRTVAEPISAQQLAEASAAAYERLRTFLRNILAAPEAAVVPTEQLPQPLADLAQELEQLREKLVEVRLLALDLAAGRIHQAHLPQRENVLADPLKALHGMLQHLLWLMQEVGAGDYKQRLHFARDLSAAFNQMVDYLVKLSYKDRLTGLLNGYGFEQQAEELLAASEEAYFLLSTNINDFKHYNALYGPERGDALLISVGGFLKGLCQEGELCGRLQADNFICLVRGTSAAELSLRFNMEAFKLWPGLSLGTNLFRHGIYKIVDKKLPFKTMLASALFVSELLNQEGKQEYAVFDKEMAKRFNLENRILKNFARAIANEEFVVYYQPKVKLETGKVAGAEALTRWLPRHGELLLPNTFIRTFENNGLITTLDFYVVEHVCRSLKERQAAGKSIVPVAVNFSRIHLLDHDFVEHLLSILQQYQLDPQWLELEVTETVFFENMEAVLTMITKLHQAGFRIAMDDFGSGFSSLNILKNIPMDVLKVDKLFLRILPQMQGVVVCWRIFC